MIAQGSEPCQRLLFWWLTGFPQADSMGFHRHGIGTRTSQSYALTHRNPPSEQSLPQEAVSAAALHPSLAEASRDMGTAGCHPGGSGRLHFRASRAQRCREDHPVEDSFLPGSSDLGGGESGRARYSRIGDGGEKEAGFRDLRREKLLLAAYRQAESPVLREPPPADGEEAGGENQLSSGPSRLAR